MTVTIFDLGLGNMHSVHRAIERVAGEARVTRDPADLDRATSLVVPGQGAYRDGARAIQGAAGDALRAYLASGRPYLGICLGMQLLFETSEEAPDEAGLAHFSGFVKRFSGHATEGGRRLKVPNMGWSPVTSAHPLLDDGGYYYFVHSYHCVPDDPDLVVASAPFDVPFAAAVAKDNVFACQFHPEKSQRRGAALLERFLAWS